MNKLLPLLTAGILLFQAALAQALPNYDGFGYTAGTLGVVGGAGGWDNASFSTVAVTSGNLTGPAGFPAAAGGMLMLSKGSGSNYITFANSGQLAAGQVYFSFLFRPGGGSGASSAGLDIAALTAQDAATPVINVQLRNNSGFKLGVKKAGGTSVFSSSTLTSGATYLVVGKYDYSTSPHTVGLWILSTYAASEAAAGAAAVSISSGTDFSASAGIGRFYWNGAGVPTAAVNVDELRIGTSWAEVVSGTTTQPPPATGNEPLITDVQHTGTHFSLHGINGTAGGVYDIVAATNLSLPPDQWSVIGSNYFSGTGTFDFTYPVDPAQSRMFYRLRVGGTPHTVPTIDTQPQNQTVTVGGTTVFSVAATGTEPLIYQWFFGNAELPGATQSSLTLTGVTADQAGNYYVRVTNSDGPVTSSVVTLTVLPSDPNPGPFQILQAEDAVFAGAVDTSHAGYTGTGFVDSDNAAGAYIEWEFGRQSEGTETVVFRFAHGKSDDRSAMLTVNGVVVNGALAFPPTGGFTTWQTVTSTIPLVAGRNTLRLTALNSGGLANMDRAEVTGDPQYKLTVALNGRGSVSFSPSNATNYYNPGTSVTLTAQPLPNATFTGWSGALSGTSNPQPVVVNSNTTVTASFQNAQAFNLYVSPTGSDSNPGTIEEPFYSLHVAVASAFAGDVIYLRGGTYQYSSTVLITGHNSSDNPVLITAYPGETPVLNWSNWTPASEAVRGAARGMKITGSYWHLKGFEISHAPDNGIKCEGHHNTVERVVFHHNGDSGIQIGLNKEDYTVNPSPDTLAAHNLVLNCDSYRNADPATSYENADGFACKLYAGKGNKFQGCRAWENCDDGWDCYQTEHEIVLDHCWAWHNGDPSLWGFSSFSGDGNCFKLGGDNTYCPITVLNCVALDAQWGTTVGFAFNNNTAPITLYNCSSLNCGRSYKFAQNGNIFKNCLDWNSTRPAPVDITGTSTQVNNSWNLPVTVTAADFASVLAADAVAPRQADGSLPDNGFARLVSGSDLIDKGVDVSQPFNGGAPDLGAYEYAP